MRKRMIRAALPAVAVAAALVLTGCKGDEEAAEPTDDTASEGADQGGEYAEGTDTGSGESEGPKPEDVSEIDPASLPEGMSPQDLGGMVPDDVLDLIPWEELEDLIGGEEERTPATNDELQGDWYTGPDPEDATLSFEADEVMFVEDWVAEGDICYGATIEDGASLELPYCTMYGDEEWANRTATLEFQGSTLIVTWEDGTEQEYQSDSAASM